MNRSSHELVVTKHDFVTCGWEGVLSGAAVDDHSSMWLTLSLPLYGKPWMGGATLISRPRICELAWIETAQCS